MNKVSVSITVAAYNVQEWLSACLESIEFQKFKGFEVIVVDDCSSDSTSSVIERFVSRDSRFRCVRHEKNQGLAEARRTGLRHCEGEYVWQIDADDYIPPDALEILHGIAEQDQCDFVRGRFKYDFNGKTSEPEWFLSWPNVCNTSFGEFLPLHAQPFAIWLNFFRRSFITSIDFPVTPRIDLGEDMVFNSCAYVHAKKVSLTTEIVYFYRRHGESYTMMSDISRRRYLEEARSHFITFSNWENFPFAQLDFMLRSTPHRREMIIDACTCRSRQDAIEVIQEYQKIYKKWVPNLACDLIRAPEMMFPWNPEEKPFLAEFVKLMHYEEPEVIYARACQF